MRYLFFLLLLLPALSQAQPKSYIIGAKGDTLNRVDRNGKKQGRWVVRVDNLRGERGYEEEGEFNNDVKEGYWRRFSLEGDLIAIESYRMGYKHGKNMYFNNMGEPLREENWRAIDPSNPYDTVAIYDIKDANKIVSYQIVKVEPNSYKHGTWVYYDPQEQKVWKTEKWVMDKLQEKEKPATAATSDDDMAPIDPTKGGARKDDKKTTAKPREVVEYEKKNSGKKKVNVRTGATGG